MSNEGEHAKKSYSMELSKTEHRLRKDLENELDYAFDEIREMYNEGTNILMEFRRKAVFVNMDGEEV